MSNVLDRSRYLLLDPLCGADDALLQCHLRRPIKKRSDESVIRIPRANTRGFRGVESELNGRLGQPSGVNSQTGQVEDGDRTIGANVHGVARVGEKKENDSVDSVVNEKEATALHAVPPYLYEGQRVSQRLRG